jgi:hypothetical protein
MPHRVEYSKDGAKATVYVDFKDASLDNNLDPTVARFVTLKNVLVHHLGVLKRRGALKYAVQEATFASLGMAFCNYHGIARSGVTHKPYYYFPVGGTPAGQDNGADIQLWSTTGSTTAGIGLGFPTMIGDQTVAMDTSAGIVIAGGTLHAEKSGAAGVFTTGSTAVTGLSSMTSAHIGSLITMTQGASTVRATYQIVAVPTGTTATLDRAYGGDRSTVASTWTVRSLEVLRTTDGVIAPSGITDNIAPAEAICSAWGRLVVAAHYSGSLTSFGTRIRWSGLIRSQEGTTPFTGEHGFHPNGYLDVNPQLGRIQALVPHRNAVVVQHEFGLTILYGSPTFEDVGSLDASSTILTKGVFPYRSIVSTPYGLYVLDAAAGLLKWDGGEHLVPAVPGRDILANTGTVSGLNSTNGRELGYYRDYIFVSTKTFSPSSYMFHIPTGSLIEVDYVPQRMTHGRNTGIADTGDHYLAGSDALGVYNIANMVDYPGTIALDAGGNNFNVDVKTGSMGDFRFFFRARKAWLSYRTTDLTTTNPEARLTVTSGLPDTSDTDHTWTSPSARFPETTNVETVVTEISIDRDPMIQARVLQVNGAGKFDLYALTIECEVEGRGPSE